MKQCVYLLLALMFAAALQEPFLHGWERSFRKVTSTDMGAYHDAQVALMDTYISDASYDLVFLGDSHLAIVQWQEVFNHKRVVNRAIGGETTNGVLARLETIIRLKPARVVLMVGVNDLIGQEDTPEEAFATWTQIVSGLQQAHIEVIAHTVPPLRYQTDQNASIVAFNKLIASYCQSHDLPMVDVYNLLAEDGKLPAQYTYDGIHLTAPAYTLWIKALSSRLN